MAKSREAVTGMKLNWFSPVPPTPSSIALDTAAILPALSGKAEVTVWVHEASSSLTLNHQAEVRRYDPQAIPWSNINSADVSVYHFGNQTEFHGPIWQVSRQHPGIVVLHDLGLQHFFAGLLERNQISRTEYLQMMDFHHPGLGRDLAEAFLAGTKTIHEICEDAPLTGAALENAVGVAVHTKDACAQLSKLVDLPVAYVPLFAAPLGVDVDRRWGATTDWYRIIVFGFIGLNRRLEYLIAAMHEFPSRQRYRLDIYGTIENEESIRQLIEAHGLQSVVTLHGFVSETQLNSALERSHLAINLRDPTMGEASASQLRIWQHGLPSLVTDIGWYATLPKNTVAFVRRDAELEDIAYHLENFLVSPTRYRELGENGRRYVQQHHTVEAYVDGLLGLARATIAAKPRQAVSWVAGRAGKAISRWYAEEAAPILITRLARTISDVFDERVGDSARSVT